MNNVDKKVTKDLNRGKLSEKFFHFLIMSAKKNVNQPAKKKKVILCVARGNIIHLLCFGIFFPRQEIKIMDVLPHLGQESNLKLNET